MADYSSLIASVRATLRLSQDNMTNDDGLIQLAILHSDLNSYALPEMNDFISLTLSTENADGYRQQSIDLIGENLTTVHDIWTGEGIRFEERPVSPVVSASNVPCYVHQGARIAVFLAESDESEKLTLSAQRALPIENLSADGHHALLDRRHHLMVAGLIWRVESWRHGRGEIAVAAEQNYRAILARSIDQGTGTGLTPLPQQGDI